jgi:DNA-binding SARP family transcriptional activator
MLEFRLLGPFEVSRDGEIVALGGMRRRAVLAMLVLEAGRVVPVGRLVEGVWGEEPPETAVTALHGHVSHLRRALGDVIVTRSPGYLLDVERDAVDVQRFEALVERARAEMAGADPASARRLLADALALWRGTPLADLADAPFALAVLPALEELGISAQEEQLEAELALGETDALIPRLKALVAEHPLRERLRGQLMLVLYRAGRKAEALDSYDAGRRALSE